MLGTIACRKPDLAQGVFKTGFLGELGQLAVVINIPARALFDVADNQPAADIGYPISKLDRFGTVLGGRNGMTHDWKPLKGRDGVKMIATDSAIT